MTEEVVSTPKAAKAAGLTTYQGNPCKRGHSGTRYTSNATCVDCGREKRLAAREISLETKRLLAPAVEAKRKEDNRRRAAAWNKANPGKVRERCDAWHKAHPQKVRGHKQSSRLSNPVRELLHAAKGRAREFGRDFDLEESDITIPDKCPALGIPLIARMSRTGGSNHSPSLDRVDSSLGYIKGNVAVISWRANILKNNATSAELRMIADYMDSFTPTPLGAETTH